MSSRNSYNKDGTRNYRGSQEQVKNSFPNINQGRRSRNVSNRKINTGPAGMPRLKISDLSSSGEKMLADPGIFTGVTKQLLENNTKRKQMIDQQKSVDTYNLFDDMVTDKSVVSQMHIGYLSKCIHDLKNKVNEKKVKKKWISDIKRINDKSCDYYYNEKFTNRPLFLSHKLSKSVDGPLKSSYENSNNALLNALTGNNTERNATNEKPIKMLLTPIQHHKLLKSAIGLKSELTDKMKSLDSVTAAKEQFDLYKVKSLNVKNQVFMKENQKFFEEKFEKHHLNKEETAVIKHERLTEKMDNMDKEFYGKCRQILDSNQNLKAYKFNRFWSDIMFPNTEIKVNTKGDLKNIIHENNKDPHNKKRLQSSKKYERMQGVQRNWERSKFEEYQRKQDKKNRKSNEKNESMELNHSMENYSSAIEDQFDLGTPLYDNSTNHDESSKYKKVQFDTPLDESEENSKIQKNVSFRDRFKRSQNQKDVKNQNDTKFDDFSENILQKQMSDKKAENHFDFTTNDNNSDLSLDKDEVSKINSRGKIDSAKRNKTEGS